MLKQERQSLILAEINKHNKVHSTDLSIKLNVSEDTIRRDLNELSEEGHIKKVHGGAMSNPVTPLGVSNHHVSNKIERLEIMKKCLPMIKHNAVLVIEGEETSSMLVENLSKDLIITVFTNSLPVATRLFEFKNIETFLLGGKLSAKKRSTVGMDVIHSLSDIHADICFMELPGIHSDIGMTEFDKEYAETKRAMIKASSTLIALCLSKNIGSIQPFKVEGIGQVDKLITELSPDSSKLEPFHAKGVEII